MPLSEPTFANHEGHKIAYYSYGAGPDALVFIHGWTCDSALYNAQEPLFSKYKRTVLVDYFGHGNSDAPDLDYSMETFAESIKAALDHGQVTKAVFVSHSMGGPITTEFLRLFPDVVKGIIYVDSFWRLPEHYLPHEDLVKLRQRNSDDDKFRAMITGMCGKSTTEHLNRILQRMISTPKHVRISATGTESRPRPLYWDEVYDIPALHIATLFAKTDGYWKHHIPQLELQHKEWEDCSHFPFVDQPERFNRAVEKWIGEKRLLE